MAKFKERQDEISGVLLIAVSLLVLFSILTHNPTEEPSLSPNVQITNPMGILGVYLSHFFVKITIGYFALVFPLLGVAWGWFMFSGKKLKTLYRPTLYLLGAALIFSAGFGVGAVYRSGGVIGRLSGLTGLVLANFLMDFLGTPGTILLLVAGSLVMVRTYFDLSLYAPVEKLFTDAAGWMGSVRARWVERRKEKERQRHTQELLSQLRERDSDEVDVEADGEISTAGAPAEEVGEPAEEVPNDNQPSPVQTVVDNSTAESGDYTIGEEVIESEVDFETSTTRVEREYELPHLDLLDSPPEAAPSASHEELVEKANFLVQSMLTFGVEGKVVSISPGPIITLFEVEPAEGVRVNKFVQLSDDLARVMQASRVRVIAPIPGKATVGIEIPNKNPSVVYMKPVINSEKFVASDSKLTVALGKTTNGENFVVQLDKLPHLLVAGTTGSGKSVCINTIITSLLFRSSPRDVRFVLIDLKKLELASYKALEKHHLITSEDIEEQVITTPENAVLALRAVEKEMGRRYDLLAEAVVRNIQEYGQKFQTARGMEWLPYIVVVIDELADLMLRAAKEVELPIARLAQMSRAVGIHLVVATQRPSVDVITGVIKANFPARMAFQVASKVDSRTIIDTNGAEKLLGRGDMLFLPPGSSEPIRIHNSYITLEEITRIVEHVAGQPPAAELMLQGVREELIPEGVVEGDAVEGRDALFKEAVTLVVTHRQGSVSLLQRRLGVGYARAARLIDQMELAGIVGPFTGSKAREVLVDDSYLQELENGPA